MHKLEGAVRPERIEKMHFSGRLGECSDGDKPFVTGEADMHMKAVLLLQCTNASLTRMAGLK
jgi:hypothetical protein